MTKSKSKEQKNAPKYRNKKSNKSEELPLEQVLGLGGSKEDYLMLKDIGISSKDLTYSKQKDVTVSKFM